MSKYYFITTFLPPIEIGKAPEISSRDLDFTLKLNLTAQDYQDVHTIRRAVDMQNLKHLWRQEPFEESANFTEQEVEEYLLHQEEFPPYVFEFIEKYKDKKERLAHFDELLLQFYTNEIRATDGFVKDYLIQEREKLLVFTALRAKKLKRSLNDEFAALDPSDPFIQEILQQNDSETYEPPARYKGMKLLFEEYQDNPLELYKKLSELEFEYINDVIGWHTFDTKNVLGYVVKLRLCERWMQLNKEKGLEVLKKILG